MSENSENQEPSHEQSRLPAEEDRKAAESPKRIVKDTKRQQWIIAGVVALGFVLFIAYFVFSFQTQVEQIRRSGVVVEKVFVPAPETQITVGAEGVEKERIPGNYYLKVRLDRDNSIEVRYVDPGTYARYAVGDPITLLPPRKTEWDYAVEEVRTQEGQAGEENADEENPDGAVRGAAVPPGQLQREEGVTDVP